MTTTMLIVAGMSVWMPRGPAGIDQVAFPLVLLPMIWAALFFHAYLDPSLRRVMVVAAALSVPSGGAIAWNIAIGQNGSMGASAR